MIAGSSACYPIVIETIGCVECPAKVGPLGVNCAVYAARVSELTDFLFRFFVRESLLSVLVPNCQPILQAHLGAGP